MTKHLFLPGILIEEIELLPQHHDWLTSWLQEIEEEVEHESVSASMCLQAAISELVIYGELKTDWLGVFDACLTKDYTPIAYSQRYGQRLYKFNAWLQAPVHAIHDRWWVQRLQNAESQIDFLRLIEERIQPSGWIYDPNVSPTGPRTRMKSELTMSMAMGVEILSSLGQIGAHISKFETTLASEPMTSYLSAEYFRLATLEALSATSQSPVDLDRMLEKCQTGKGYVDFDVSSKRDPYMGAPHRSWRDLPVHSPISAIHAEYIAYFCAQDVRSSVSERVQHFGAHIRENPLDIPAFHIRDFDISFGTGASPLEVITASWIVGYSQL